MPAAEELGHLHQVIVLLMIFVIGHFGLQSLGLRAKLLHKLLCELRNFLDLCGSAHSSKHQTDLCRRGKAL